MITLDGRPIAADLYPRITLLRVEESVQLPDAFEIHFEDAHFELFDTGTFSLGSRIAIAMRTEGGPVAISAGEVTTIAVDQVDGRRHQLVVSGFDLTHRLSAAPKRRSFQRMSDADIAGQIAREYSLDTDIDSTGQVHEYLLQANETDARFLRRRAARIGFDLWVTDRTFHFKRKPEGQGDTPTLTWGDNLNAFKVRFSMIERCDEVVTRGWNPLGKRVVTGTASRGDLGTDAPAAQQMASAAQSAFGHVQRFAAQFPVADQAEADSLATSLLLRATGEEVKLRGESRGNPRIGAGGDIHLDGVGSRLTGRYRVTSATHLYGAGRPYVTQFVCGGKDPGALADLMTTRGFTGAAEPAWGGITIGQVTNNDDPEHLCRVKVKFPALSDEDESAWARLVTPGGGPDRGLQWVPEINDEVLVAFELGDHGRPMVLGGLWNRSDKPPKADAVSGGRVDERLITSRKQHRLSMVDGPTSSAELSLGDSGCLLHLEKSSTTLEGEDELVLSARRIEIRASDSMTITAPSIAISASGELTVAGQPIKLN